MIKLKTVRIFRMSEKHIYNNMMVYDVIVYMFETYGF